MLHELFITHCTNSTLVMNPFTAVEINPLQLKHGCAGINRSEEYHLMILVSAWLMVILHLCASAFLVNLLLEVHVMIIYQYSSCCICVVHHMHGYLSHVVQRIPEIIQNGMNVKEYLLIVNMHIY